MTPRAGLLLLLIPLLPAAARAAPIQASYAVYAAGLNVLDMDAAFDIAQDHYRVHLAYRTLGAFRLVMRADQETTVDGRFAGGRAAPQRFVSNGMLRGQQRLTQIEYHAGQPVVRQLIPPNEQEREPVAPAQQVGTIDTVSAMAQLVEQVNRTGRCDGTVTTFDGRRLSLLVARTLSEDELAPSGRSSFAGRALHCSFEGRQLGGFKLDEDRAKLQRPQHGSAWFASMVPGGPRIPVRVVFQAPWFGEATMYLTGSK